MKRSIPTILCLLLATAGLLLTRCATRGTPGGGPEDKAPPIMESTEPANNALNVPCDARIRVTFSKWIAPDQIIQKCFVSPAHPAMKAEVSGRTLTLVPAGPLLDSTTYVVTVGTEVQDFRGNRLAQAVALSFSTGATLDSGSITGSVLDESGRGQGQAMSLFAYRVKKDSAPDPVRGTPDYVTQTALDGSFRLASLKYGAYRLFAVTDYNRNRKFDPGREHIGFPSADILLSVAHRTDSGMALVPVSSDTAPVVPLKARYETGARLAVSFSRAVAGDSTLLSIAPYSLLPGDTLPRAALPTITAALSVPGDTASVLLLLSGTPGNGKFRLRVVAPSVAVDTLRNTVFFSGNALPDTLGPRLLSFSPANRAKGLDPRDSIQLAFSEPVRAAALQDGFLLERVTIRKGADSASKPDTLRAPVKGSSRLATPLQFVFKPDTLEPDAAYAWSLAPEKLVDLGGVFSTEKEMHGAFSTRVETENGAISGKITTRDTLPLRLQFWVRAQNKKMVELSPDKNGYYAVKSLPEGSYRILVYADPGQNGRFNSGTLAPFRFAEKIKVVADSVSVRQRWEIENFNIGF
ncbi:MAG: Ig-like domain-containing protein [Fibrobacterota bacterium]